MGEQRQEVAPIRTMILAVPGVTRDTGHGTTTSTAIRAVLSTMSARLLVDEIHLFTKTTKLRTGSHASNFSFIFLIFNELLRNWSEFVDHIRIPHVQRWMIDQNNNHCANPLNLTRGDWCFINAPSG